MEHRSVRNKIGNSPTLASETVAITMQSCAASQDVGALVFVPAVCRGATADVDPLAALEGAMVSTATSTRCLYLGMP